ncbi:hypothetical protein SERLA73DRAFT_178833 [Serpula lacrymans var. lacrymans S7.3]|uniref:Uncharacterized protein n=2 Tax=Serpula lacrymans var. lacrymans TaxID=341189 RepID=F8PT37_SERL3|nr:uncharacterized protein SERLADRAFT_463603 [Serpula lacrymans var. lacrymans S7.9]EGO00867.1 hypothetical protein SERLA73DRAFT_178833 [Serpula lacrymans var. lacrymans S7.3]EGO26486.1 hypothetical protein SERLADRAFT_463603 [Serpula lacrymans var. lacrymans S7.9]
MIRFWRQQQWESKGKREVYQRIQICLECNEAMELQWTIGKPILDMRMPLVNLFASWL